MAVSARWKTRGQGSGVWKTRAVENPGDVANKGSGGKHRIWWKTRGLKWKTRGVWKKTKTMFVNKYRPYQWLWMKF